MCISSCFETIAAISTVSNVAVTALSNAENALPMNELSANNMITNPNAFRIMKLLYLSWLVGVPALVNQQTQGIRSLFSAITI